MLSKVSNLLLFRFVSQMMQAIALNEKYWLDYVLQDYFIYYACRRFPLIGQAMTACNQIEFKNRGKLASLMNNPYNDEAYHNLIQNDYIFKLSFRANWHKYDSQGQLTFYGHLIEKV